MINSDHNKFLFVLLIYISCSVIYPQNNRANLENKFRLGKSYERAGELQKAENIFRELVNMQQWNQRYVKALNDIYLNQKKYDLSIELLNNSIKANRKDINFYGMLGTTYFIMNNKEKAYEVWDSAINEMPNKQISYKLISNFAIENRDFDKAIEYLTTGKEIASNPLSFSLDLARIYVANMKYGNAASEYCDVLLAQPMQLESVKRYLAGFITRPGAASEVEEAILDYISANDNRTLKELLAYVYVSGNSHTKAFELMKEIDITSGSEGVVLYKFAQELFTDGEYETALSSFESILTNYPNSKFYSTARMGYAKTLEALADRKYLYLNIDWKPYSKPDTLVSNLYADVINAYENLIDQFQDSQIAGESYYRIAKILFEKRREAEFAIDYLMEIINSIQYSNYYAVAYELLGKINLYTDQLDNAESYFQKALLSRGVPEAAKRAIKFQQAQLKFWGYQFGDAVEMLAGISSHLRDDITNDALEFALTINLNKNDSLNLATYANALLLAEQDKFDEAFQIFDELSQNQSTPILSRLAQYKTAQMRIAQGSYGTAIDILDKIIFEDKSGLYNDKSLFLKANIYQFALNNIDQAILAYRDILENHPNSQYFDKARDIIQKLNNLEDSNI